MKRTNVVFLTVMLAGAANCFADIIPISAVPTNTVPSTGSGYGAVATLLNAQDTSGGQSSDGLEANCDVFSGGSLVSQCSGPFSTITINDPANQNHAVSLGSLFTSSSNIGSELLLIFNTNQIGPHDPATESINLDILGLAIWNGTASNTPIFSTIRTTVDTYDSTLQGVGVAGFGYKLTFGEASTLQGLIDGIIAGGGSLNNIFVTGAFEAGCLTGGPSGPDCANDGAETLFVAAKGPNVVPEPMSLSLVGGGLLALGLLRKKRFSA